MEFTTPVISDLRFSVDINNSGNIAQDGETAAGQKNFTVKYFATFAQDPDLDIDTLNYYHIADYIVNRLMSIVLGTYVTSSLRQTITRKAA